MTFFNKKTNDCNLNTFFNTHFNIRKHDISSSKNETSQHNFNKDVPVQTDSNKMNSHQNLEQHTHQTQQSKKGKIPKKRNKLKKDNISNIPMKSTLPVFKNQLRPDLSNNNSIL